MSENYDGLDSDGKSADDYFPPPEHEPWCEGPRTHAGACEAPQDHRLSCALTDGHGGSCEQAAEAMARQKSAPIVSDPATAMHRAAASEIAKHLPTTVAAGIVADLTSVQSKIPAELRVDIPPEIATKVNMDPVTPPLTTGPLDWESKPPQEPEPREIDWSKPYSQCSPEEKAVRDSFRGPGQKNLASSRYDVTRIGPVQADEIVRDKPMEDPGVPGRYMVRTTGRQFGKNKSMEERLRTGDFPFLHPRVEETEERLRERLRLAMGQTERPIVIGLGGYQEHGKDALADILVERHGFMKFGMSDAINEILMVLDPLIPQVSFPDRHMRYSEHVEAVGYTQAKKHPEVRRLLRTLGTEVGRDMIDPDIWVNIAGKKIHAALRNGAPGAVVTGIRNGGNEIGLVALLGGTTVWVDRPGHPIPQTTHASENTLTAKDFEMTVSNFGTLEDLAGQADAMLGAIRSYRAAQRR